MLLKLKRHFTLMSVSSPFSKEKGQSACSMLKLIKNKENEWGFNVKCKNEITEGQMLGNSGRS